MRLNTVKLLTNVLSSYAPYSSCNICYYDSIKPVNVCIISSTSSVVYQKLTFYREKTVKHRKYIKCNYYEILNSKHVNMFKQTIQQF